jgi:CHRD domain
MRRFRHLVAASAVAVAAVAVADSGPVAAEHRALSAFMTGAKERPGPGDRNGVGFAGVLINTESGRICYALAVRNIEPATMAHIHRGTRDIAGPIVVHLTPPNARGFSAACADAAPALAAEIAGNPGGFYVNVHNTPFPAGAVRGQLG